MKINKDVNYVLFSKTMCKTAHFEREREREFCLLSEVMELERFYTILN